VALEEDEVEIDKGEDFVDPLGTPLVFVDGEPTAAVLDCVVKLDILIGFRFATFRSVPVNQTVKKLVPPPPKLEEKEESVHTMM
jgi:hypothetical protein